MNSEVNIRELDNLAIDLQGVEMERAWIGVENINSYCTDFLETGVRTFDIPDEINELILGFFDEKLKIPFRIDDCAPGYWHSMLTADTVVKLNNSHIFYGPPALESQNALVGFLEDISGEIEREMASAFAVTNVRAVASFPDDGYGPTEWHFDGSARFLRKILIYPQAMNAESGTLEICDRVGKPLQMHSDGPIAILCDTSILQHRGRPGTNQSRPRPMLEVTITSAAKKSPIALKFAGQNARIPKVDVSALPPHFGNLYDDKLKLIRSGFFNTPSDKKKSVGKRIKRSLAKRFASLIRPPVRKIRPEKSETLIGNAAGMVNIGGGPGFRHAGWLNFDEVDRSTVDANVSLNPEMLLPVSTRSIQLIYSSHCIEHLSDATIARMFEEALRVIAPSGSLVLKIPDFELVLERYRQNDGTFFQDHWNIDSVTNLWPTKGVEDSLAARASFIFAGYWNASCGNPFEAKGNSKSGAYHGPAPIATEAHEEILKLADPREISQALCRQIGEVADFAGFNHRNAWSRQQLADLVSSHGFDVLGDGDTEIQDKFAEIPGIREMSEISQYLCAKPSHCSQR